MRVLSRQQATTADLTPYQDEAVRRMLDFEDEPHPLPLFLVSLVRPLLLDENSTKADMDAVERDRLYIVKVLYDNVRHHRGGCLNYTGFRAALDRCLTNDEQPGYNILGNITFALIHGWNAAPYGFFMVLPPLFLWWCRHDMPDPEPDNRLHDLLFIGRSRLRNSSPSDHMLDMKDDKKLRWMTLYQQLARYLDRCLVDMTVDDWVPFAVNRYSILSVACALSLILKEQPDMVTARDAGVYNRTIDGLVEGTRVRRPVPPKLIG